MKASVYNSALRIVNVLLRRLSLPPIKALPSGLRGSDDCNPIARALRANGVKANVSIDSGLKASRILDDGCLITISYDFEDLPLEIVNFLRDFDDVEFEIDPITLVKI